MGAYEVLVAQNVALKFGNDRQHACEGAVTLGVVRSRASLDETNPTFSAVSSLQGGDEIDERLAPAIESP